MNTEQSNAISFLSVLEENYQAQIAGYYNHCKTDKEREVRQALIDEYKDLIIIYKQRCNKVSEPIKDEELLHQFGKMFPNEDVTMPISRKCAEIAKQYSSKQNNVEAIELLLDCKNQIQYLHDKFKETGSGNAILSKIENYLTNKH